MREFRVLGLGKGAELGASVSIELNGKTYCPLHDHRGNITTLVDSETKQSASTYRYSAFGEELLFGEVKSPWRFFSKRVDPESNLVFFGRRYYSPEVGRFLTPDPLSFADGPNLYSYVHNSPMILVDPYGLASMDSTESRYGSSDNDASWVSSSESGPTVPGYYSSQIPGISLPDQTGASGPADGGHSGYNSGWGRFCSDFGYSFVDRAFSPEKSITEDIFGKDPQPKSSSRYCGEVLGGAVGLLMYIPASLGRTTLSVSKLGCCVIKEIGASAKGVSTMSKVAIGSRAAAAATKTEQATVTMLRAAEKAQRYTIAAKECSVGEYTLTKSVCKHLNEVNKLGELERPFLRSPLTIQEIVSTGRHIPDPRGLSNALRYDVSGPFRGSQGNWELVVDPVTKTIYHYNFTTRGG